MRPFPAVGVALMQSALALGGGIIALYAVGSPTVLLVEALAPASTDPQGMPLTPLSQGLFLPALFLAGFAGSFVVVLLSARAPVAHAIAFGVLALAIDVVTVAAYAAIWPFWFSAAVLFIVPPQVLLGALLGLRARRRWPLWGRRFNPAPAARPPVREPEPPLH